MILVLVLIVLVVAALMGIWGLSSSRMNILRAGGFRAAIRVQYEAEEALQQAVKRMQEIADPNLPDSLKPLYSGPEKTIDYLVDENSICRPPDTTGAGGDAACTGTLGVHYDVSCPGFNSSQNLDGITKNVVCNFLGTSMKLTQVMLVRKPDFTGNANGPSAVYLVNAVSTDLGGRQKMLQGIAVIPYTGSAGSYALQYGEKPYLATTIKPAGG